MREHITLEEMKKEWGGTLYSYAIGLISSFLLTAASFALAIFKPIANPYLLYAIVALAFLQAIIQLLYFLHLSHEDKPYSKRYTFYFMLLILLVIVIGSLWIMHDLNSRMMPDMVM